MRRLDRRGAIRFRRLASESVRDCPVDRAALLARFHASENGRLLSGAAAFAAMWRAIPVLRPLGLIARVPLVLALLEKAYRGFPERAPTPAAAGRARGAMLRPQPRPRRPRPGKRVGFPPPRDLPSRSTRMW